MKIYRYSMKNGICYRFRAEDAYQALQHVYADFLPPSEPARLSSLEEQNGGTWIPATYPEKLFHLYVLKDDGSRIYLTSYPEPAHKAATLRDKGSRPHLVFGEWDKPSSI